MGDAGEDPECHAAKLLEVIILQCKGQIDQVNCNLKLKIFKYPFYLFIENRIFLWKNFTI